MQQPDTEEHIPAIDPALFDQHAPTILAYLCRHLSNAQDAEDLLVEVFLAALSKPDFPRLTAEYQQAWLRSVAHHKLIDHLRQRTRLNLVSLGEALEHASGELTPEQYSVRQESYAYLYQCVVRLSPEQQELIQLRYGEGLRLVDIAARLHKPDGTVRKQLLRTLRRLRTFYHQPTNEREN